MVKGISRQVIVVQSPDKQLFDQAIFILSDAAVRGDGVTEEKLLREAKRLMKTPARRWSRTGAILLGAIMGAVMCCAAWVAVLWL